MNLTQITAQLTEHLRNDTPFTFGNETFNLRDRQARIDVIGRITADIPAVTDADRAALERLADAILYEELTDDDPHKVAHNEYPIFSQTQLDRRQFGQRGSQESNIAGEAPDNYASRHHAVDGGVYGNAKRRERSKQECTFIDDMAIQRNRVRNALYKRDTSPGPVISYNLHDTGGVLTDEFIDRIGISRICPWNEVNG